ncbi:type II toxin-antitoxin system HicA family toxin [Myxococcota bacterium]|nr:type II toxin-antitoxin system HicA family toxin [Myxococcota bacterium]
MNSKHKKTFESIFSNPVNGMLEWQKIESLFLALGAEIIQGSGSRVAFVLNGEKLDIHRPHPAKEALRYRVKDARQFLINAGVKK